MTKHAVTPPPQNPLEDRTLDEFFFVPWAAGFFDGEGCIAATERKGITPDRCRYRFNVVVSQVTPEPLLALQARWGGHVTMKRATNPKHRDQWTWLVSGDAMAAFLSEIAPFLRVKQRAVSALLQPGVISRTFGNGRHYPSERVALRAAAFRIVRSTNLKGRRPVVEVRP